jgi:predicted dehydrogenase
MRKVKLALIGAGNIAQSVHLPILRRLPTVELVAICDRNYSKARAVAERFDIPYAVRSIEQLRSLHVEAVDICSSTATHAEIVSACIEAGWDIFVERPLALTSDEAALVAAKSHKQNVKLMVGMNHRFRTDVVLMKNYIEQQQLGHVYYAKAGWLKPFMGDNRLQALAVQQGRGVLFELGLVIVDLLLYLFRSTTVRSVTASVFNNAHPSVEDVAIATINFTDGSVASLETSWSLVRPEDLFYCNVYGRDGSAFLNPFKVVRQRSNGISIVAAPQRDSKVEAYTRSYEAELKHFIAGVQGLVPIVSTADEAVERLRVVEALYQSALQHTEVQIPNDDCVYA